MEAIRVFAGVPLPIETRVALAERIGHLDIPGKIAPAENWHLTLRFLGSVDQVTYERFLAGARSPIRRLGRWLVPLPEPRAEHGAG